MIEVSPLRVQHASQVQATAQDTRRCDNRGRERERRGRRDRPRAGCVAVQSRAKVPRWNEALVGPNEGRSVEGAAALRGDRSPPKQPTLSHSHTPCCLFYPILSPVFFLFCSFSPAMQIEPKRVSRIEWSAVDADQQNWNANHQSAASSFQIKKRRGNPPTDGLSLLRAVERINPEVRRSKGWDGRHVSLC